MTTIGVILCAAGKGLRTGFPRNKLLMPYNGEPVLKKTLSAFDFSAIAEIVVTANEEDFEEIQALCAPFPRAKVVLGGTTRARSVYNALQALSSEIVLVHDGARPFVSRAVIEECIESVKTQGSGVCAVECADTVAVVADGKIVRTPARDTLRQIQTPQGFYLENLRYAYERAFEEEAPSYTDDSSVFAAYCGQPRLCKGAPENKKLTYAEDFLTDSRCGVGIDTHAFGKPQDYILLAGVKIPSESGLVAHSDGDVLVHAVMDALLSAAGLRDIGYYFPDSDERWKNANSMELLQTVVEMLAKRKLTAGNLSVAVQAEKPRLKGYIEEMKNALAGILKLDPSRIGISAGTNEGLGYIGEGKGITVHAYATLKEVF